MKPLTDAQLDALAADYIGLQPLTDFDHKGYARACIAIETADLMQLINTPELVDFPKAVHAEAVHQLQRWGTDDRQGKEPADWFWLIGHLAGRALEHHKEAVRLADQMGGVPAEAVDAFADLISHHEEKAVHHCITTAAALSHWHACVLGRATRLRPGAGVRAEGEPA